MGTIMLKYHFIVWSDSSEAIQFLIIFHVVQLSTGAHEGKECLTQHPLYIPTFSPST